MGQVRPTPPPSTVTPSANPEDHYWLYRPVPDNAQNWVSRFYPYGSTAGGQYQVHHGVEFENPTGMPVLATAAGTVVVAGDDSVVAYGPVPKFYGKLVVVRLDRRLHDQPVYTLYAHLEEVYTQVGQAVERGDLLGVVGMTGIALGPHLHFEVRVGGNTYWDVRNPELWLRPFPGMGTLAGRLTDETGEPVPQAVVTLHRVAEPETYWRETETYPRRGVNPDDEWGENFLFGDVPAGAYVVRARVNDVPYSQNVQVTEGQTTFVVMGH